MNFPLKSLLIAGAAIITGPFSFGQAFYGITKGLNYVQTSPAAPVLQTQAGRFEAFAEQSGTLRLPNNSVQNFNLAGIEQRFATAAAMDAAYPAGIYVMTLGSSPGVNLTVVANPYPVDIPRVIGGNWGPVGRLLVDPSREYTLNFNTFTGYNPPGGISVVSVAIEFGDTTVLERDVFSTDSPIAITSVTIPAGTLVAGRIYNGRISFLSAPALLNTLPGSVGVVIGANETEFQLVATSSGQPVIRQQPLAQSISPGATVVFTVAADNATGYQWRRGAIPIPGAIGPTLVLSAGAAVAANYNVVISNPTSSVTSANATLTVTTVSATEVGRLINLSVLAPTGPESQLLTMGTTVGGQNSAGNLPLIIRGVGPTLGSAPFNVPGTLPDPVLSIFPAGSTTPSATNDNWGGTPALSAGFANVGAFALPNTSLDSAALHTSAVGGFTVQIAGKGNATGTVIAEVYDASGAARTAITPRLTNLSTLTGIAPGDTLSAGFVIGGRSARTVLVRAVGPTLGTAFNLPNVMADPKLELFDNSTGTKIAENNDWSGSPWLVNANTAVGAFALGGPATRDAAILITLAPGAYSARVSDANGGGGTAIIEVYEVP